MFRFPVGIQLFNRPDYAERTLNSIYMQSLPVDSRKLFIFIDGFKGSSYESHGSEDKTAVVEEMAKHFFPDAQIEKFNKNFGIAEIHNRLQKLAFSGSSPWSVFFEEDVELDPLHLGELSNLIEIADDCEQIARVACFQVLPALNHLPRGNSGFYPGLGTKAFAERLNFFIDKQSIVKAFLELATKNLNSPDQFIDTQNSAELALSGHFLPYFQHDSLVQSFLNSRSRLHVVTKPHLAKDIGVIGMNNFIVPSIRNPPTNSELDKTIRLRKHELNQQLDQIKTESQQYLTAQYKEIFERFHILNSRKSMLKKLIIDTVKPKN
jgi:hypothetical protein